MEAVDYHFVYAAASVLFTHAIKAAEPEIAVPRASDVLRMTGFGFGARGHAKHLLKSPKSKLAPRRTKSKYYFRPLLAGL
jgi:hypothetical protein